MALNPAESLKIAREHHLAGRMAEAEGLYRNVLGAEPNNPEALHLLGVLAAQFDRFEPAVQLLKRALEVRPDYFEAHNSLGLVLAKMERFEEALISHRRALALKPDSTLTFHAIGVAQMGMQNARGASESYRRCVESEPNSWEAWNGLGKALQALGEFEEAAKCYRRALSIKPDLAIAYANLARTGEKELDVKELDRLKSLLGNPSLATEEQIAANFAMANLLNNSEQYDEAFSHFRKANSLVKEIRAAQGEVFDGDALRRRVDELIRVFDAESFAQRKGWGISSELPVFIVGMPRSGTSLVEQIAASHPDVFGAGELKDIGQISDVLNAGGGAQRWSKGEIEKAAKLHLQRLKALGAAASRVIDKMPDNVFLLGLIADLFPAARIILCRRDALDNCLSCYFQWLTDAGNAFAYDLADCGTRYVETNRLMNHWADVLPLQVLDIQYEALVADLEGQSRRLIEFLGLPWNDACLKFHEKKRAVLTASAWQVRQPIYSSSVRRWRHYQKHIGPLINALGIRPEALQHQ